jgi:membrane dipeptidase
MGIDHFAFGPDMLFGYHVGPTGGTRLSSTLRGARARERAEDVEGLENLSEFPNVVRWLVASGY